MNMKSKKKNIGRKIIIKKLKINKNKKRETLTKGFEKNFFNFLSYITTIIIKGKK